VADTTENAPKSGLSNVLGYLLLAVNIIALPLSIWALGWGVVNLDSCMGAMNGIVAWPILFVQLFILLPLTIIFTRRKRTIPLMLKRLIRLTLALGISANIALNVICIIYARLHGIRFFSEYF
jgi:hypothetical protein